MSTSLPSSTDPLTLTLDLLRRLPPRSITQHLSTLSLILPPETLEDLLSSIDQPLSISLDNTPTGAGREYLTCDYSRDGDSWRSPFSNEYEPPLEDGTKPSERLRQLEIKANEAFDSYRQLYFEGGLSSVYLWDLDEGFAGVVLLKKDISIPYLTGNWDSIHVFEATELGGRMARYKLTSTVMLGLLRKPKGEESKDLGEIDLSGSLTRQLETESPLSDFSSHIPNLGRMIEDVESKMRSQLQEVYFGKTTDVVQSVRSEESLEGKRRERELQRELMGLWKR